MGHPHDDSDAEVGDRPQSGRDEPKPAMIHGDALLDHHIAELQAAFDELAHRNGHLMRDQNFQGDKS